MTNYTTRLYANNQELDLFDDEVIKISNNVTGLFDIDKLPGDFTRQLTIPGTRKNNAFFQHYYSIDVETPFLFTQDQKVECYLDISGYLLVQGYIQLNNVNVQDSVVTSYDITLYGSLSNFSRDLRTNTLNDISSLSVYNHTSSYENITSSWDGGLFGGDIVYPLIDYGKGLEYSAATADGVFGIDDDEASLFVKDFKPAIRVKKVVDKIFEEFGYTYSSSFFEEPMWNDIYMVCNYGGQYPIFQTIDVESYGIVKIRPTAGTTTDTVLTSNFQQLLWDTIETDASFAMGSTVTYNKPKDGPINGKIKLNLHITGSGTGTLGYPKLDFALAGPDWPTVNPNDYTPIEINKINDFLEETYSQLSKVGEKTYTVEQSWYTSSLSAGEKRLILKSTNTGGSGNFTVTVAKDENTESYWSVDEIGNAADYEIMDIPINMPFGEKGITCLEFIQGLQKKYNLVITPSKTLSNHFEIETFNTWYKNGSTIDITEFIDISKPLKVIPANSLAVNELEFSDKQGQDFLARDFLDENNRSFGKSFYQDNQNQFSQGKLEITTDFSASPLRYVNGSGDSDVPPVPPVSYEHFIVYSNSTDTICRLSGGISRTIYTTNPFVPSIGDVIYLDIYLTQPLTGYSYARNELNDLLEINPSNGQIIGTFTCQENQQL